MTAGKKIMKKKSVTADKSNSPAPRRSFTDNLDLPAHYDNNRLVLMSKDPSWIYAYWDIMPSSIEKARSQAGDDAANSHLVLRMYDVTCVSFDGQNANHSFDLDVGHNNNWYINVWRDNTSYLGELGLRTNTGRFIPVCRSNNIQTPRSGYSHRTEQVWMEAKEGGRPSAFIVGRPQPAQVAPAEPRRQEQGQPRQKIYLSDDEIRKYYSSLTPLLRQVISHRLGRLSTGPHGDAEILLDGESDREKRATYELLTYSNFVKKVLVGSSGFVTMPGGSEQLAGQQAASEFNIPKKKDRFFFNIGTELIVYGKTEPDAEVSLGDKKIQLREDGTFSIRYLLPDGKIPLDFTATSSNKVHRRKISTTVTRHTAEE